jgi:hypothetical protein
VDSLAVSPDAESTFASKSLCFDVRRAASQAFGPAALYGASHHGSAA